MDFQQAADEYKKHELAPMPLLRTDKRKIEGWVQYQTSLYNGDYVDAKAIAIVCGTISKFLTVVDIDVKESEFADKPLAALLYVFPNWTELKEKTWIVKTPSNGWHVYFRTPGVELQTRQYDLDNKLKVEFRSHGVYVMAPPSPASTEKNYPKKQDYYTFISKTESILEVDPSYFEDITQRLGIDNTRSIDLFEIWNGTEQGNRNNGTFTLCMALLDQGAYESEEVFDSLCEVNKKHKPPMSNSQLKTIFESAKKTMEKKRKSFGNKSMKDFDSQILEENKILFQSSTNNTSAPKKETSYTLTWKRIVNILKPYIHKIVVSSTDNLEIFCIVSEPDSNIKKTIDLGSRNASMWAMRVLLKKTESNQTFGDAQIDMALKAISSVGTIQGVEKIYNRVAMRNNHIYIDMATPDWKIVKIGPDGYDIIPYDENCPIFARFQHQAEMVMPMDYEGDPLDEFADLLLIKEEDKFIYKVLQVAYFFEAYPILIMLITGEHGSAKSTTEKGIINVVDPTNQNLTTLPTNIQDLILRIFTHYMVGFDNISKMTQEQSDVICTAVTGGGNEKRKLYSDKDMAILSYMRKIALNGIAPKIDFSDLRDRTIHIETKPITKKKTEKEFYQKYNALVPKVRKQIFELLSKSLAIYPTVEAEFQESDLDLPRMADFTICGECISRSMDEKPLKFYDLYLERVKDEKIQLATEYPMVDFIDHKILYGLDQKIDISLIHILDKLLDTDDQTGGKFTRQDLHRNQLPETPRGVIPHLTKIASLLRERGINFSVKTETNLKDGVCPRNSKYITFERKDKEK